MGVPILMKKGLTSKVKLFLLQKDALFCIPCIFDIKNAMELLEDNKKRIILMLTDTIGDILYC